MMPNHQQTHETAVQNWARHFQEGELQFSRLTVEEYRKLPENTREFLDQMILPHCGLSLVSEGQRYGQYLFLIDAIGYLAHCPRCSSHTWGRLEDFGDLDNSEALARLWKLTAEDKRLLDHLERITVNPENN